MKFDSRVPDSTDGTKTPESTKLSQQCTVIVVPYNHEDFIEPCLESVYACDPGEVIVVDGGSSDDTQKIVRSRFPDTELIEVDGNPGYGACNNIGAEHAAGEYVVILNPDTRLEPDALETLLSPLAREEDSTDVTTPKILQYDGSAVNTCGNSNHITGFTFVRGFGDEPSEWDGPCELTGISGACFATKRAVFEDVGGFDDAIFLYMEDAELSWRLAALDKQIEFVPESVVYHDYERVDVSASKLKHLEIGRYTILKKYLDRRTYLLLLPSLLMAEVLSFGYAALLGLNGVKHKLEATYLGLTIDVEPIDTDPVSLLRSLDHQIPVGQLGESLPALFCQRAANLVFRVNHRLINK